MNGRHYTHKVLGVVVVLEDGQLQELHQEADVAERTSELAKTRLDFQQVHVVGRPA